MLPRVLAVGWTPLLLLACASGTASPHPHLASVWREYQTLPEERALAVAGDPRRNRWVSGASGGHGTREQAETGALGQCQQRRRLRRMRAACVLYAVGDEILWRGP